MGMYGGGAGGAYGAARGGNGCACGVAPGEECTACGVGCGGGGPGSGAMSYVGTGHGGYIQETTYIATNASSTFWPSGPIQLRCGCRIDLGSRQESVVLQSPPSRVPSHRATTSTTNLATSAANLATGDANNAT